MTDATAGTRAPMPDDGNGYVMLFRSHPVPMLVFAVDTLRILDVNDAAVEQYGYARADFTRLTIRDIRPDEDVARLEQGLAEARPGRFEAGEWRHRLRDGTIIDVRIVTQPIDYRGRPARLVSVENITPRKESEQQLRLLRAAFHAVANAILVTDRAGNIIWVNAAFEEMTGYPAEEAMGRNPRDLLRSGQHSSEFYSRMWRTILDGAVWRGRMINRARDGRLYHEEQTITPVRDGSGRITHFIAVKEDVTERLATEDRLRFKRALLDAVGEAVIATDLDGRIVYWNHQAEALYGWPSQEVIGRGVLEITASPDARREAAQIYARVCAGETWSGEFEVLRRDGATVSVHVTDAPIRDDDGRIVGVVGVSRDLTATRALEHELLHAQKLEAVGRLAGGIAHDFNNVLTAILGHTEFLLDALPEGQLREDARTVHRSAHRAGQLTQQLLAFSRKQVLQPKVLDLGAAVRELENLLRPTIGEDVRLSISADPDAGRIAADPSQIEQVVVNLVVNARDAMPEGGVIRVRVDASEHSEVAAQVPDHVEPGRYVRLEVADTGIGMDAYVADHLFEPFFTTKGPGKGTGLGLSTVYGIVRQSGGHVVVNSRPGDGTTFRVYLPRVDDPLSEAAPPVENVGPTGDGKTVLLVEDEEGVRTMVRRVLERTGYRVVEADTPGRALDALAASGEGEVQLIITDIVMPEMSGVALVEKLLELQADTPVIFMSGYAEEEALRRGMVGQRHRFVAKPFTPAELADVVAEVLRTA